MISWRTVGSLVAGAVLLLGCTDGPGGGEAVATDGEVLEVSEDADQGADGEARADVREPSGSMQLSGFREDQASATSVALHAVEVDEGGHIHLGIEAVNSGGRVMRLNGLNTILADDVGNHYRFVPPRDNGNLTVQSDQRMTGTLVFEGPIDPAARRLVLGFNQQTRSVEELVGAEDRRASNQYPVFLFRDVPLPGVGLEDEAGSGEQADLLERQVVEVDQTVSPEGHPDVEITVVSYETDGRVLELDLEAVNRSSQRVSLVSSTPVLVDDLGSRFGFLRADGSEAERRLILEPGDEASVTLGFRATLHPDASELRLTLNSFAFSVESQQKIAPGTRITLPMPEPSDDQEDA